MINSQKGTALVITLLLTVVVMTMGIYTLSKIKPFSENIKGLEHSMQARYHARSGEEVAKLIYYSDLEKAKEVLNDSGFESKDDNEKAKAFCRTDGAILSNSHYQKALRACMADKMAPHIHDDGTNHANGHDESTATYNCVTKNQWEEYLPSGVNADTVVNQSISYNCSEGSVSDTQPIKDTTGGVDTHITSQTAQIPQQCQGNSSLTYSTDGDCQYWNKLTPGDPVRLNLSNIEGLTLDETGFSGGSNYSFAIRFRLPDLIKEEGNNPEEVLFLSLSSKDDPMVLWNIYDDNIAFFPAESDNAITRFQVFQENKDNNGKSVDEEGTSGRSLGNTSYKGVWEDTVACELARSNPSSTTEEISDACTRTLIDFFENELGGCINRSCFLELQLVGDLSLGEYEGSSDPIPDTYHEDEIKAPYLEYQVIVGHSGGTSGGDELKINDTHPVITSVGESGGYSVQTESIIEEDLLIPTASSPIGR